MKNDVFEEISDYIANLQEPENLFSGKRLPSRFALPDNLLIFFHNFTETAPNSHGRCTLVFPLESMIYYVDGNKLELSPGTVLYVAPYAVRFLHPSSDGYGRLFVTFDDPGRQNYLPDPGLSVISASAWTVFRRFLKQYREGGSAETSLELFHFLKLLHPMKKEESTQDHRLSGLVSEVIKRIESNLSNGAGVKELAEGLGLSESHLRMIFRREMGVSLGRFLIKKRLDAAQYRLLHSEMPLNEIAKVCGFRNVYVFAAFFKKNTGIPPLKFRKQGISPCGDQRIGAGPRQGQSP